MPQFNVKATFKIKQGDTLPSLQATLMSPDDTPVDLSNATVEFVMLNDKGDEQVERAASITDAQNGVVRFDWQSADTQNAGTFYGEFRVTFAGGGTLTIPNDGYIAVRII